MRNVNVKGRNVIYIIYYILISSANIPAELHVVVCPFTRPSFLFSLSNFPTGRGRGGSGDETKCYLCTLDLRSYNLVSRARLSYTGRESGQIPIIISCLTRKPAFSEHVPIMFTPTSLSTLLLSMQHQSLMGI